MNSSPNRTEGNIHYRITAYVSSAIHLSTQHPIALNTPAPPRYKQQTDRVSLSHSPACSQVAGEATGWPHSGSCSTRNDDEYAAPRPISNSTNYYTDKMSNANETTQWQKKAAHLTKSIICHGNHFR